MINFSFRSYASGGLGGILMSRGKYPSSAKTLRELEECIGQVHS